MPGAGGPYETRANILTFLQKVKSDLVLADITDTVYNASTEMINNKTDTYWEIFAGDLYINGEGTDRFFSPVVPIVTLTNVQLIFRDGTTEDLITSGVDKQVWFNDETGEIARIDKYGMDDITRDPDPGPRFPEGLKNIKITGTFGRDASNHDSLNILKLLQTLLVMKIMNFQFPSDFRQVDLIQERIGEYEYRIGDMQTSKVGKNQKMTLEGYIDYLFNLLPKDDAISVMGV